MSSLFYLVHCLVVFGVPVLFGWVVLQLIVRERDWMVLLPGSLILGVACLMVLVNELRHHLEMNLALWDAYKILLGATLLLVVVVRRRFRPPVLSRALRAPWKRLLLGAGAIFTAIYYGIPAFSGFLNDAWWSHYPMAIEIQTVARFPLHHIMALDDPLFYHYGPDIIAATWSFLLKITVQQSYALLIATMAPAIFLLAAALAARMADSFWGGLLAGVAVVAGGNLRFLFMLAVPEKTSLHLLQALNSQTVQGLNQMIFTPSHAVGAPLLLLCLILFRHFATRPSLSLAAVLGLLLGALSLVAEWYFFPLLAALAGVTMLASWRREPTWPARLRRSGLGMLPLVVALACTMFNGSYVTAIFGKYWMQPKRLVDLSMERAVRDEFQTQAGHPHPTGLSKILDIVTPKSVPTPEAPLPLRLNRDHLGYVPTWESAGANQNPYISLLDPTFLAESLPIILLGLPLGLWFGFRDRRPLPLAIGLVAAISLLPPLFLDWNYRSVDFLRFFTGAFICSALAFAWLVTRWIRSSRPSFRLAGGALAACVLVNPIALGAIGLMPSTLTIVKDVNSHGTSLSAATERQEATSRDKAKSYAILSGQAGKFLAPLTQGRERALVLAPDAELPPLRIFPEWMKFITLAKTPVPIGWYWETSTYSLYYREAVHTLSRDTLVRLDIRWIVRTNLWLDELAPAAQTALDDPTRFVAAASFQDGPYFLTLYRVVD